MTSKPQFRQINIADISDDDIERINDSYQDFGAGQFIWRLGDPAVEGYIAASDARRDGLVAGY